MPKDPREEGSSRITRQEKADAHSRLQDSLKNHAAVKSRRSSALDNPEGAKEQTSGNSRCQVLDTNSNILQIEESDEILTSGDKCFSRKGQDKRETSQANTDMKSSTEKTPMSLSTRVPESKFSAPLIVHPSVKTGTKHTDSRRYREDCVRNVSGSDKDCHHRSRKLPQNSAYGGSHFPRPLSTLDHTFRSNGGRGLSQYGSSRSVSPGYFDHQSPFHYTARMPHELSRRRGDRWSSGAFCETPPHRAAQDYCYSKSSRPRSKTAKNFTNLCQEKIATHFQPLTSFHERPSNAERTHKSSSESTEEKQDVPKEVRLTEISESKQTEMSSHEVSVLRQESRASPPTNVSMKNLPNNNQCASLKSQVASPNGITVACAPVNSLNSRLTDLASGLSDLNVRENETPPQGAASKAMATPENARSQATIGEEVSKCSDNSRKTLSENVQRQTNINVNVTPSSQRIGQRESAAVYIDASPSGCADLCPPVNIHYDQPARRSIGREAKEAMNESTSSISNAEIQEEMSRAKKMSLPVNFDRNNSNISMSDSYLNPSAHEFSPSLTDGFGNRYSMSSRKGVVYFRPDTDKSGQSNVVTQLKLQISDSGSNEIATDHTISEKSAQNDFIISTVDTMPSALPYSHDASEILTNTFHSSSALIPSEQDAIGLYNQSAQVYNISYYDPVFSESPVNFPQNMNSDQLEHSTPTATLVFTYPYTQTPGYEHFAQNQENSLIYLDTPNSMQEYTPFGTIPQCTLVDRRLQVNMAATDTMQASANVQVTQDTFINQFGTLVNTTERCLPQIATQHQSHGMQPARFESTQHNANPYLGVPLQYFEAYPSSIGALPQSAVDATSLLNTGQQANVCSTAQTGLVLPPQMPLGSVTHTNVWSTSPAFYTQPQSAVHSTLPTSTTPIATHRPPPASFGSTTYNAQTCMNNTYSGIDQYDANYRSAHENSLFSNECPSYGVQSSLQKANDFQAFVTPNCLQNQFQGGPYQTNSGSSSWQSLGQSDHRESVTLDETQSKARHPADRVSEAVIRGTVEKLFLFLKTSPLESLWSDNHSLTDQDKSDICTVQTLVGFLKNLQRNFPNMTDGDLKEMLLLNLEALTRFYERPNMMGDSRVNQSANQPINQSANQNQGNFLNSKSCPNEISARPTLAQTQTSHSTTERTRGRQFVSMIPFLSESHNSNPGLLSARVPETETARTSTQRTDSRDGNVSQISTLNGRRPPSTNVRGCRRPSQVHHGRQKLYSTLENGQRSGHFDRWSSDKPLRRNL